MYKRKRDYSPAAVVSSMYAAKRRRVAVADASRARHFRRVGLFRGPYRTGGFYGASVRSPAERKVVDTASATYQVNTTGSVTLINGIATGTDFTNRIGRRVNLTAVQARGFVRPEGGANSSTALGGYQYRFMLVQDLQNNGSSTVPAITDILEEARPDSFMNLNNRERFKVLYDKQGIIGPRVIETTFAVAGSPSASNVNVYKKCNIPMVFEGTAATLSSISSGSVYAVWVGSSAANTDDLNATMSYRVRFVDA